MAEGANQEQSQHSGDKEKHKPRVAPPPRKNPLPSAVINTAKTPYLEGSSQADLIELA